VKVSWRGATNAAGGFEATRGKSTTDFQQDRGIAAGAGRKRILAETTRRVRILQQLPRTTRRQDLEGEAGPLFAVIPCESVPEAAGDHYAKIKLTRQQKGLVLDENDLWIAATALALDAVLITRDTDFQHIEGLSVND
jgi:predicted nucleic acid-binding protein